MDDQMVENVAHAIAPYSFDPNRIWGALISMSADEVRENQQNHVRDLARKAIKVTGVVDLRAALDAAQDEIEKLISEKEALRERLEWEQPEPDDDVIEVSDYTGPQDLYDDDYDAVTWGRVHKAGEGGPHSEWKGYKNGGKVYLDWPELVRRWGPLTVTSRSGGAS